MSKPKSGWYDKNNPIAKVLIKEVKEKYGENKIKEKDVVDIMKLSDGRIVWLENGEHTNRGLAHIATEHLLEFKQKGINKTILPTLILDVAANGTVIGYQGKDRPIYEYNYCGKTYYVAISISDEGFIVGANPRSKIKEKERNRK